MPTDPNLAIARQHVIDAELVGDEQEELRGRLLEWIDTHHDALHRSCLDGHLTGSGVVVDPSRPATLLIHHKKLGMWLQPGGHADGEGDLAAVALREAEEETGLTGLRVLAPAIDLDIHGIPERGEEPAHQHLDVRFVVVAPPGAVADPDQVETLGAAWVEPSDPDQLIATAELHRLVARAFEVTADLG